MSQVVVVVGGGALSPRALELLEAEATVIAADSGLDHAVAAGLAPSRLVGDLDSVSAAGRMWAYAHGTVVDEYPAAKDLTDTELAIAAALEVPGIDHLVVVGGVGDRLDHLLGTLLALGHPALGGLTLVRAVIGDTEFAIVHAGRKVPIAVEPGQTFSLLALHGPSRGVTLTGAEWELDDDDLSATEARGVSNTAKEETLITVTAGVVTVVIP